MDLLEVQDGFQSSVNRHPWEVAKVEVVYYLVKQMCPEISRHEKRIFDIGCGDLFVSEQLSKLLPKSRFIAVDTAFTDQDLVFFGQKFEKTSIRVYKSLDEALAGKSGGVDIVLLLDVIEHIQDPINFLKMLRRKLFQTHRTVLILTAPAFQWLFGSHDNYMKHCRRYNNRELLEMLFECGFKSIKTGYFFGSLLLIRIVENFLENIIPNFSFKRGVGGRRQRGAIDKLITKMLFLDFRCVYSLQNVGVKVPGLSNFAVCRESKHAR